MISLCTFIKNEAHCIGGMIESVKNFVDEIVVVDTGSTDASIEICRSYNARIYKVGFTDFGSVRTLAAHLARESYVLMLDADERIDINDAPVIRTLPILSRNALAFPRKRWLDLAMTMQTEKEAYPDWQVRFFRNNPSYNFKRELHEYFDGAEVHHVSNPVIHHFHDVFHSKERLAERKILYERLAKLAHVTVEGGKVLK